MPARRLAPPADQRGASLLTALIILVAVTILALGSLGTSLLELRMSSNHEASVTAKQTAQAALDAVLADAEASFIVTGNIGNTRCVNLTGCDGALATLPAPLTTASEVRITRTSEQGCPPAVSKATSCANANAANFEVESMYDNTLQGGGNTELVQGYIKLIPVSGQALTGTPGADASN